MCTFGPLNAERGRQRIKEETALALIQHHAEILASRPLWCMYRSIHLTTVFSTDPVPVSVQINTEQGLAQVRDTPGFQEVLDLIEITDPTNL